MTWAKEISEGPTWGPQPTRARLGSWRALVGCAHLVHLPLVLFAPRILKYSEKYHVKFLENSENFYFWVIFITREI